MRRLSRREKLQEEVRRLDVFPKVEPEIQQRTPSGALTTIVTVIAIVCLIVSEFYYYRTVDVFYEYKVDLDMKSGLNLTLDLTVAMPCAFIGADYIDVAGKSHDATLWFKPEPARFELAENQLEWLRRTEAQREVDGTHGLDSLQRFLHGAVREPMPAADPPQTSVPGGCRLHGTMPVNKVAANFHITAGKSVHHSRGHSHMAGMVPVELMNFSHRIDRLSFSEEALGAHTLDGDIKLAQSRHQLYQYFIKVVPTSTQRLDQSRPFRSNQYSVTEQVRVVEPTFGAMGMPGIFVKYDLESISVSIREGRRSMVQFLVRLCAIVGGMFATSGMLHQFLTALFGMAQPQANLPDSR